MEEKIKQLKFKHVAMTAKISTYTHTHTVTSLGKTSGMNQELKAYGLF